MKALLGSVAVALFALGAIAPSFGEGKIVKVNAPIDHQFKFGIKKPKHQSHKQTAWVCFTWGGQCHVPFLGACCCQFAWGYYCGST